MTLESDGMVKTFEHSQTSSQRKAGIIHQPEIVKPTYENWIKDKVRRAVIDVSENNEESRRA